MSTQERKLSEAQLVALKNTLPLRTRYEAIYSLLEYDVRKFCLNKTRSNSYGITHEEISQEGWLMVWKNLHSFDGEPKTSDQDEYGRWLRLRSWVFIVFKRRYLDILKSYAARPSNFAYILSIGSIEIDQDDSEANLLNNLIQQSYDFTDNIYLKDAWEAIEKKLSKKDMELLKLHVSLGSVGSLTADKIGMSRKQYRKKLQEIRIEVKELEYFMGE